MSGSEVNGKIDLLKMIYLVCVPSLPGPLSITTKVLSWGIPEIRHLIRNNQLHIFASDISDYHVLA